MCVCYFLPRPHRCMSSFQSCSTFSSENLSVSDGEEGNTSDHSHSGPLERLSASQEEHLDELLSHTPDIPIDISTQSDGLSDKECAVRRVKTQISLGKLCSDEHSYEVSSVQLCYCLKTANTNKLHFRIFKENSMYFINVLYYMFQTDIDMHMILMYNHICGYDREGLVGDV